MSVENRGRLAVAIDGHRFQVDLSGYQRGLVPWQRQPTDDGAEAGLSTLNTYGAWRRFQSDFGLGSGQQTFDRPDDSRRRVHLSDGVTLTEHGAAVQDVWVPSGGLNQTLVLDGVSGSYLSTPDDPAVEVTQGGAGMEVLWFGAADTWMAAETFASKWDGGLDERCWLLRKTAGGEVRLDLSDDGTTSLADTSSGFSGTGDGDDVGVRVTWRASDGRVQFFSADTPDDPVGTAWTQVGGDGSIAVSAPLHDSDAPVEVGTYDGGTGEPFDGTVSYLEVRDGLGGPPVMAPAPAVVGAGATEFHDRLTLLWTLHGGAEIVDNHATLPVQRPVLLATTLGTDDVHTTYAASGLVAARTRDQSFEPYWEPVSLPLAAGTVTHLSAGGGFAYVTGTARRVFRSEADASTDAFTAWSTLSVYDGAWYVNGRVLAAFYPAGFGDGPHALQELDAAGDESGDPVEMGMIVEEVVESPFGIYAVGYDSRGGLRRGIVKRIPVADDGSLGVAELATELPVGERVFTAVSLSNYLILGASKGARLAQFSGGGTLSWFPRVDIRQSDFDALNDEYTGVHSLVPHADQVWFASREALAVYGPIGWLTLSEFTAPGVPSFQTHDLEGSVQVGDVSAHFDPTVKGDTPTILSAVGGVIRRLSSEGDDLVSEAGEFITGWIGYGVPDEKVPTRISLQHRPIPVDGSIEVYLELDDGSDNDTLVGTADTLASTETVIELTEGPSERFRLRFVLSNGSVETVRLKRWTMLAVPVPTRTRQFVVPIMAYEEVSGDGRQPGRVAQIPRDIMETLETLAEDRIPVTYEEGDSTYRVVVDGVELPEDESRTWDSSNNFPQGTIVVTLLTVD